MTTSRIESNQIIPPDHFPNITKKLGTTELLTVIKNPKYTNGYKINKPKYTPK